MTARAYYNEIEPTAAHVLRALISDGVIAPGDVDERSIKDVRPSDLEGYTQYHFFAGGGLWSVAARLAGWPDDRSLWTGSCPCQPFSVAGKGVGEDDPRHLWPDFFRLIRACRPAICVGEQVAGKAGRDWFHGVRTDLEGGGYAGRAVDVPACAVDAPHIRQRLYWVAQNMGLTDSAGWNEGQQSSAPLGHGHSTFTGSRDCGVALGDADRAGQLQHGRTVAVQAQQPSAERAGGDAFSVADTNSGGRGGRQETSERAEERGAVAQRSCGRNGSFWSDHEWLAGADGKTRRVKPGLRLLVDGLPGRVGLLRIGGNAIVAPLAAEVLAALMETQENTNDI